MQTQIRELFLRPVFVNAVPMAFRRKFASRDSLGPMYVPGPPHFVEDHFMMLTPARSTLGAFPFLPPTPRPFVEMNEDLEKKPFGAPGLGEFVASQPREAAVRVFEGFGHVVLFFTLNTGWKIGR